MTLVSSDLAESSLVIEPAANGTVPSIDGKPLTLSIMRRDETRALLRDAGGNSASARRLVLGQPRRQTGRRGVVRREIVVDGWRVEVETEPERWAALRDRAARGRGERGGHGATELRAIIPGVVVSVAVAAGDDVVTGQQLLVIEAMKMQNELRAPRAGTIARVAVQGGQTIELGDLLVLIE
jgi:biotin carboxyl carrier protein